MRQGLLHPPRPRCRRGWAAPAPDLSLAGTAGTEPSLPWHLLEACDASLYPWQDIDDLPLFPPRPHLPLPTASLTQQRAVSSKIQTESFHLRGGLQEGTDIISLFFKETPELSFHDLKDNSGALQVAEWAGKGRTMSRSGGPERTRKHPCAVSLLGVVLWNWGEKVKAFRALDLASEGPGLPVRRGWGFYIHPAAHYGLIGKSGPQGPGVKYGPGNGKLVGG